MKKLALFASLLLIGFTVLLAQPGDYLSLKQEAEKFYAEGSYARAYELYKQVDAAKLEAAEARWVSFRLADTIWRAQAGTETPDSTKFEQAQHQLEALVRDIRREEDRDRVWVEVQESLGDFYWTRRDSRNWSQGWTYYQQALESWAASSEIDLARRRYLNIVWKIAKPQWVEPYYYYGYYGNIVPLEILENVLKIAVSENDKAHAHYLIAMTLRYQGGDYAQRRRVPDEFEAALKAGKTTDWYDDALYYYAEWMSSYGRVIPAQNGQWRQEPDFVKALELYRRFVAEHVKGESRYYDQAKQQIETITKPVVGVSISNIFLPESEIQFYLNWRNVKKVDFAIYRVDLTRDVEFAIKDAESSAWIQQIRLASKEKIKAWPKETGDKGDYRPGQETVRLDGKLPTGAYVLEASSGITTARDLILITDASLVLKTSGKKALAYFCNALNGSPIPNSRITLWERNYNGQQYVWREESKQTNQDGIAVFELVHERSSDELFASAAAGDRQAFSIGYSYSYGQEQLPWRIYAFTDRPAYRPDEQVQWKFIARQYNGSIYSIHSNQTVEYEITDPRGSKIKEDKATLNLFGSAWDSLKLTAEMPLGEYRINFWDQGRKNSIGSATLFRMEEYKLPEFKVSVQTPEENGKKKAFRLGEKIEVNIQANYYFGGPVSNATVEVLVYQNPYYHWWQPLHEFPWFYEDTNRYRSWYGQGQVIKRETLKTDADGKAALTFETPGNSQQDYEYRIEARVTDASRREITGTQTVRVTQQRYYVHPQPEHFLYRPQDKVTVNLKALDANEQPVQAEGSIKVTRETWYEIWIDPTGKEIKGDELKALRDKIGIFPPPTVSNEPSWKLKFQGYEHDEILTRMAKTDAQGEAALSFTPERDGYYRISWLSEEKDLMPVRADTTVWVTTNATSELGYRHGGLEIIVDKDTFHAGQKAGVMLSVPTNDRYVLLTSEGDELYDYQLVHVTGTVKLIELPVEEKHVPNFFLSGVMISDRQIFQDTKEVVVPPVDHFLQVEVKPDRDQYQPREEGTLTLTTRDHDGKPVSAEVALGLVDESVFYIQQDYAGDPRQFFFGDKRSQQVQTQSTFQQKSYAKLSEGENKILIDVLAREEGRKDFGVAQPGVEGGAMGAVVTGVADESNLRNIPTARDQFAVLEKKAAAAAPAARELAMASQAAPPEQPAVVVRTDFRSTVFWQPDVVTGKDGTATVKVKYPDSLTSWKATARVESQTNQFGIADTSTRTRKPLIVRLQAPRFFVVGDTVTISAVVNNNTDHPMTTTTLLEGQGLVPVDASLKPSVLTVEANGEARADWRLSVAQPGSVKLTVTARGDHYADAMEKTYLAFEHGIEKFVAKAGKVRGDDVTVLLNIPKERKPESTHMMVQVTPSLAVTMLDALPYLIRYPYGCTEQTMSRFLPTIITKKTLKDLAVQGEIEGRLFGGIESATADKTHSEGKQDLGKIDAMVKAGLDRLYDFQHSDGGWGWWKEGESDHFMTAYVVWGLTLAQDAGTPVRSEVLTRGADYLQKELVEEEENYDEQAWMLHALASYGLLRKQGAPAKFETKAFENIWTNRDHLNAYTRALLALSAHNYGYNDQAMTLVRNLENGVKADHSPDTSILIQGGQSHESVIGTAHWGEDGIYWRWSDGGTEATAFALRALLAIDPQNKLIEPVTNWLIKNRRGAQWSNTRDTAITVLALNDYLRRSGELNADLEYELSVNGHLIAAKKITNVISAPSQFDIDRKYIQNGDNEIHIRRKSGAGPIYFATQATYFSLEEPVSPAGNEIFVHRQYYKLVGKPTLLKGYVYEKQSLNDGETVTSGDRVETVLTIEAKNNYEYLVFEDLKPAGLEAVEIRSGELLFAKELKSGKQIGMEEADYAGRSRWVYQELRDRKVALFIDKLPEGVWEIRYDLRAEVPGQFHALPVLGYAMYVPEIRCNGSEIHITVADKQ